MTLRQRAATALLAAAAATLPGLAAPMAAEGSGGGTAAERPGANLAAERPAASPAAERPCGSPRQSMRTLLHWQDEGHVDPVHAAACLDRSEMDDAAIEAPALAVQLKKVLDGRGLYIDLDSVPDDPEYKDDTGQSQYALAPDRLGGVHLVREGARWVFPPASLERVGELYRDIYPMDLAAMVRSAPPWLRWQAAGVAVWQALGILVAFAMAVLLQRLVILLVATGLHRLAGRLGHDWAREVARRAATPLGGLAMAGAFATLMPLLQFPLAFNRIGLVATRVLAACSVVWLGYRMADVLGDHLARKASLTDTKLDDQLVPIVRKFLKVIIVLIGGVFILHNLDVNVGSLLAGLGLGGAALAFAAKDSLAHVFGSLMIFLDRPFQIGDFIKVGGDVEGTVEEVGFRSTRVRTPQDSLLTVPNAKMAESVVDNLGARKLRRYKAMLGLTYDTTPERMQAFCSGLRDLLERTDGIAKGKSLVEFQDFGDSALSVLLNCFIDAPDWATEMRIRSRLNLDILRLAESVGVSFAFPTRTIHIASMVSSTP